MGLFARFKAWIQGLFKPREWPLNRAERDVLLEARALRPLFAGLPVDKEKERRFKTHHDDHEVITYEIDDMGNGRFPFLFACRVVLCFSPEAAEQKADALFEELPRELGRIGPVDEMDLEVRNDLFRWGEGCRFCLVRRQDRARGNALITRRGSTVFVLLTGGKAVLQDPNEIDPVLRPELNRMRKAAIKLERSQPIALLSSNAS